MYLRAGDTLSGQEGKATIKMPDGTVQDLFYIKTLEATFEKTKAEVRTLGKRGVQHKATGWSGSGSMTIFYVTSLFRELAYKYAHEGVDTYFTITVTNEDPGSTAGTQIVSLFNCNVDSTVLAKLDVEADSLEEDLDFTFDDFTITDKFGTPVLTQ